MKKIHKKLGEILIEAGILDEFQLNSALAYQREWGGKLGTVVIKKGFVSEKDLMSVLEKQFGISCVSLDNFEKPTPDVLALVKLEDAKKFGMFPLALEGKTLVIAISDPTDLKMLDDISFKLGLRVKPLLALESDIIRAIGTNYEGDAYSEKFRIDKSQLRADVNSSAPPGQESVYREEKSVKAPEIERSINSPETKPKPEITQKAVLEGVIDLLVAKGVFTKEELIAQIKNRKH
jgi:hypothetical protein